MIAMSKTRLSYDIGQFLSFVIINIYIDSMNISSIGENKHICHPRQYFKQSNDSSMITSEKYSDNLFLFYDKCLYSKILIRRGSVGKWISNVIKFKNPWWCNLHEHIYHGWALIFTYSYHFHKDDNLHL